MQAAEILIEARRLGITLFADGDFIVAKPKGAIPPPLAIMVRQHKADLLRLLGDPYEGAKAVVCHCNRTGEDVGNYLHRRPELKAEMARDTTTARWTPAHSIVATCRRNGVTLRIDADGTLVIDKAGAKANEPSQPWPRCLWQSKPILMTWRGY